MAAGRLGARTRGCRCTLNRGSSLARMMKGDDSDRGTVNKGGKPQTDCWVERRASGRGTARCRAGAWRGALRASRGAGQPGKGAWAWGGVWPQEAGAGADTEAAGARACATSLRDWRSC
jgi:hypothetical protein